jgi:hypothetical protein
MAVLNILLPILYWRLQDWKLYKNLLQFQSLKHEPEKIPQTSFFITHNIWFTVHLLLFACEKILHSLRGPHCRKYFLSWTRYCK